MKKSLLSLTIVIVLSNFASLFSGGDWGGAPCSISRVGWKRAWQCRNMKGEKSGPKTQKRLAQNRCTNCERNAGNDLMVLIGFEGAVGVVGIGGAAWLAGMEKRERRNVERLEREGEASLEMRTMNPPHESKK